MTERTVRQQGNQSIITNPTKGDLEPHHNSSFIVCWTKAGDLKRSNFETGISITGSLQYDPGRDQYRVLLNNNTYTYFRLKDVCTLAGPLSDGHFIAELGTRS